MKKTVLKLIGLAVILQLVQCSSSTPTKKPQPVPVDPAVEACNKPCSAAYGKCIQAAGKNEAKKTVCNNTMVKCGMKCATKAKGYKKEQPMKYQKSSEL